MAHNFKELGKDTSFVSRKEIAWHGLGKVVDAMTSEEAIKLGGLDFNVEKRRLSTIGRSTQNYEEANQYDSLIRNKGELIDNNKIYYENVLFSDKFATVRTDINYPLGIVGSRYEVFQNSEAFDFIDSIIGKDISYETAGALGNGEIVFITVKVNEEWVINKDLIDRYLLLTTSHDGSGATTVLYTPIRVVCNNTLTAALNSSKNKFSFMHTKNMRLKTENAKKALGLIDINTRIYNEVFNTMNETPISDSQALNVIIQSLGILPPKEEIEKYGEEAIVCSNIPEVFSKYSTKGANIINSAFTYYQEGVGQSNIVGSTWGVYNGISGFLQNVKQYRTNESKFKNQFLSGDTLIRNKAIDLLS